MTEKEIDAYFMGWCYQPVFPPGQDKDYADVDIRYMDGTWEKIFKEEVEDGKDIMNTVPKAKMLKVIVEHFTGKPVSDKVVKRLLALPGHSYMRTTPEDLRKGLAKCTEQLSLF